MLAGCAGGTFLLDNQLRATETLIVAGGEVPPTRCKDVEEAIDREPLPHDNAVATLGAVELTRSGFFEARQEEPIARLVVGLTALSHSFRRMVRAGLRIEKGFQRKKTALSPSHGTHVGYKGGQGSAPRRAAFHAATGAPHRVFP